MVTIKCDITGNLYVFSNDKQDVVEVAKKIEKSINSVYYNNKIKFGQ